ncbi:hypothetical protein PHYSODRAFT_334925 [Phytophthora sojae]|uniref:Uncharacterized protein n=1 Tax=Phytophthora sojae (strain P6497) TaxID=1094619 RepID=G4ZTG2_PHYSP|nr:hypothetical protein PHYSODRAFT_334925 [Phytophthora sojae]EGZ13140.1 hypothetical protein PHYSODRAFT_334925 [Phytophthora sojae]|eukprot:XP_009530569.1 hypothetical protein PHYSODRAFT_334925 [Phytophthora sojae]
MASDACRRDITFLPFHGGKTTNATKHLWETHQIQSEKTALQNTRKRDRAEEVNCILASALCRDDAKRLCLLLETIRIVYNNLPFRFGEYEESVILKEVVTKDEFKTTVNSRTVTHSLVELYASGRQELIGFIRDNRLGLIKCLTMDVDFWTPKHGGEKYLGLRIYFVDSHFRLRTVLLGTRHFLPMYGERDQGFAALLSGGFVVFCLTLACPRATSSAPPLTAAPTLNGLKWEWCIPHMVNAATKMACGLARKSHNPEMSELLNKLSQTVYGTSTNSTLGDLLPMLMIMLGEGNGTQLVGYKPHRFMGMAATMERVLEKWPALEAWYEARSAQHARKKKRAPPGFHLAGCQQHLVQLLSILTPILLVTKRSQAQDTNQVQVLLSLYTMRMTSLALDSPIRLYDTAPTNAVNIHPFQLTSLVARTGMLLQKAFYHNFFRRYVDADYIASGSYIFEMQLVMHPSVKHVGSPMDEVIAAVARTEGRMRDDLVAGHVVAVQAAILKRLKSLMRLVANSQDPAPVDPIAAPAVQANVF